MLRKCPSWIVITVHAIGCCPTLTSREEDIGLIIRWAVTPQCPLSSTNNVSANAFLRESVTKSSADCRIFVIDSLWRVVIHYVDTPATLATRASDKLDPLPFPPPEDSAIGHFLALRRKLRPMAGQEVIYSRADTPEVCRGVTIVVRVLPGFSSNLSLEWFRERAAPQRRLCSYVVLNSLQSLVQEHDSGICLRRLIGFPRLAALANSRMILITQPPLQRNARSDDYFSVKIKPLSKEL